MSNTTERMLVLLLIILKEAGPTAACSSSCSSSCNCYNKGLSSVPQNLPTTISRLYLNDNVITTLNESDFSRYSSLTELYLYSNQISVINSGAFYNLTRLTRLYLHRNQLTSLGAEMFVGLNKLTIIQLNYNYIHSIEGNAFAKLPRLQRLILSHNSFHTFTLTLNDSLANISSVDVTNNPWHCDCRMLPFKQRMTGVPKFETQIRCAEPANLQGKSLLHTDDIDLNCEETSSSPDGVTETIAFSLPLFLSSLGGVVVGAFLASVVFSVMRCKMRKRKTPPDPVQNPSFVDINTHATAEL
ncbi:SLITRK2 [Branchiostoma lanceolatum]|uniref:SLITRK2 protein n=1 Tax=Branchiostoma lanceolatum TaxID=7740 RepID=A0A8K0EJP3_BRALA|nr:SLITRK2 [Branchiostoma lanceolatum]